jgi:hypothetical protein
MILRIRVTRRSRTPMLILSRAASGSQTEDHLDFLRSFLCACRLRAVNLIKSAFYGFGCHLSPYMLLKQRIFVDSIPSALG